MLRMSKELRESMVKQAKVHAEKAKVGVRKARQKAISDLRREGASEDTTRKLEKYVRELEVYLCCNALKDLIGAQNHSVAFS